MSPPNMGEGVRPTTAQRLPETASESLPKSYGDSTADNTGGQR
jgi:hypothetical protein